MESRTRSRTKESLRRDRRLRGHIQNCHYLEGYAWFWPWCRLYTVRRALRSPRDTAQHSWRRDGAIAPSIHPGFRDSLLCQRHLAPEWFLAPRAPLPIRDMSPQGVGLYGRDPASLPEHTRSIHWEGLQSTGLPIVIRKERVRSIWLVKPSML